MKVSIIVPVYNRLHLVVQTIESIKGQSYENFECIIVDDHSEEDVYAVLKRIASDDKRFIVKKRKGKIKGAPACRNEGIEQATGKYLMFLDSDDLLAKHCIEERVSLFEKYPGKDFIVTQIGVFKDDENRVTHYWNNLKGADDIIEFLRDNGWQTSSTFFKTTFIKAFRFDETASYWQDVEFHIRVLLGSPEYLKFRNNHPHVLVRRVDTRQGLGALNEQNFFYWVLARFELLNKIVSLMTPEQKSRYRRHAVQYYLYKLEQYVFFQTAPEGYKKLLSVYAKSPVYQENRNLFKVFDIISKNNIKRYMVFAIGFRLVMRVFFDLKPMRRRLARI